MPRVERGDHPLARQLLQDLRARGGAEHDADGATIEPGDRGRDVADAAADPAGREVDEVLDHRGVRALAERGIEVDHRDLADQAVAPRERPRVAGIERLLLAADQLDRMAVLQIDRGDDHGRMHGTPSVRQRPLDVGDGQLVVVEDRGREHRIGAGIERLLADAQAPAAPPEAITGTRTARATARVSSRS